MFLPSNAVKCNRMDTYLLIKYLKCSTTPEEEAQIHAWLADDPDGSHAKQYSDAHFMYEGMLLHGQESITVARARRSRSRKIVGFICGMAAAVALVVVSGLFSSRYTQDLLASRTNTIYVPAGKSMNLTLEDGTRVWLNAGTEIEFPSVFSRDAREVKIYSGEVLFDVAKDEKRPFYVDTYASTISVLGTKFNVTVDDEMGGFSTALLRGSVKVSSKLVDGEEYTLSPNQMVRLSEDNHMYVERINNPDEIECWTDGLMDISNLPFDSLMRRFELAFDVNIVIVRDDIPEISYTSGKVRISDGVIHALEMLALAADFSYEYDRQNNVILIK